MDDSHHISRTHFVLTPLPSKIMPDTQPAPPSDVSSDVTPQIKVKVGSRLRPVSARALSRISNLPSWVALLISGNATALFTIRGESDAYAPLLLGAGIALFWSRRRSNLISRAGRWIYLALFSLLIWERSLPHEVSVNGSWISVDHSLALMACSVLIYSVGVTAWFMDRRTTEAHQHDNEREDTP